MSYDISAGSSACDHIQLLERYTISFQDFRTLQYKANPQYNMRAPINGAAMVRVYFKGVLINPEDPNYGYSIVSDPDRVQPTSPSAGVSYVFQKIVFNQPIREISPLVEVTYITRQGFCLKCGGTGNVIDWTVSPNGSLNHVYKRRKLAQQALKFVLTSRNPFNPNLTCPVRGYIGKKFGLSITGQDIAAAVQKVLSSYQSIQKAQSTVQTMDAEELIRDIQSVQATQDPNDPTVIQLSLTLLAYGSTDAIPLNLALQSTTG